MIEDKNTSSSDTALGRNVESTRSKQLLTNAVLAILQVSVVGFTPFVLYRFLLKTIGIEELGVWSLVISTTSVTRISELGLASSVVRFVAKYLARLDPGKAARVVQTAMLSVAIIVGLILLLAYPFLRWLLGSTISGKEIDQALSILPYALISLLVSLVAGVAQAGLDGCQRVDARSLIHMAASMFHLVASLALARTYGLMGLAYAQVIHAAVVLLASWWVLKKALSDLPLVPHRWDRDLFLEMMRYGVNIQVASAASMLCEPTTTALLGRFGGLAAVGYFEMAKRMIRQLRSLIVSANQVMVPFIADLQERNPTVIHNIYSRSYALLLYLTIPFYAFIVAVTPVISEIWIGHHNAMFIRFSGVLAIGWFLNTLNAPAYFANLGVGALRWNTISHVVTALLNVGLGFLLGSVFGGSAVVVAWVVSLVAGSLLVILAYHRENGIPLRNLVPQGSGMLGVASTAALCATLVYYYSAIASTSLPAVSILSILIFAVITAVPIWAHPMRRRLTEWVTRYLLASSKV